MHAWMNKLCSNLSNTYAVDSLKSAQLGNRDCADFRLMRISGHCFVYTFETIIWLWYFVIYYKEYI